MKVGRLSAGVSVDHEHDHRPCAAVGNHLVQKPIDVPLGNPCPLRVRAGMKQHEQGVLLMGFSVSRRRVQPALAIHAQCARRVGVHVHVTVRHGHGGGIPAGLIFWLMVLGFVVLAGARRGLRQPHS